MVRLGLEPDLDRVEGVFDIFANYSGDLWGVRLAHGLASHGMFW